VTLLVGLVGAVLALGGVGLTLFVTSRAEQARSVEETKRLRLQMDGEEQRQLNESGRSAIADFMGVAESLTFNISVHNADVSYVGQLNMAFARVQLYCSDAVVGAAASLLNGTTAYYNSGPNSYDRGMARRDLEPLNEELISTVRIELGLADPMVSIQSS